MGCQVSLVELKRHFALRREASIDQLSFLNGRCRLLVRMDISVLTIFHFLLACAFPHHCVRSLYIANGYISGASHAFFYIFQFSFSDFSSCCRRMQCLRWSFPERETLE